MSADDLYRRMEGAELKLARLGSEPRAALLGYGEHLREFSDLLAHVRMRFAVIEHRLKQLEDRPPV